MSGLLTGQTPARRCPILSVDIWSYAQNCRHPSASLRPKYTALARYVARNVVNNVASVSRISASLFLALYFLFWCRWFKRRKVSPFISRQDGSRYNCNE